MNLLLIGRDILSKLHLIKFGRGIYRKYKRFQRKKTAKQILRRGYPNTVSSVYIEPTERCNLKCRMCYLNLSKFNPYNEINFEKFKKIINNLPKSVNHIQFTGGEPLMSPDFIKMVDYLDKKGYAITIISNLINNNFVRQLTKYKSIVIVNTSVDGPEELHNNIRGRKDAFKLVTNGIKIINSKFPSGTLMLVCVISNYNIKKLNYLVDLAKELKLPAIEFELERRYGKEKIEKSAEILSYGLDDFRVKDSGDVEFPFSYKELRNAIGGVKAYAKKRRIKVHFLPEDLPTNLKQYYGRSIRKTHKVFCDALLTARISSKGEVFCCNAIKKSFGNIFETPLEKIWKSKEFINFRKNLLKNNLMPICETCYSCKKIGKL